MIPNDLHDEVDDHLLANHAPPRLHCIIGINDVTIVRNLQVSQATLMQHVYIFANVNEPASIHPKTASLAAISLFPSIFCLWHSSLQPRLRHVTLRIQPRIDLRSTRHSHTPVVRLKHLFQCHCRYMVKLMPKTICF